MDCTCSPAEPIYVKQRRKFGLLYVLPSLTVVGFPIMLLIWLVMPRKRVIVSYKPAVVCPAHLAPVPAI